MYAVSADGVVGKDVKVLSVMFRKDLMYKYYIWESREIIDSSFCLLIKRKIHGNKIKPFFANFQESTLPFPHL